MLATAFGAESSFPEFAGIQTRPCGVCSALRIDAVQSPGKRNRLANVIQGADPCHHSLDAHAKTGVRHRTVAAQIKIPLEGIEWQLVLLDALLQQIVGADALGAADDLAIALGRQHVHAKSVLGIDRVRLHVKGLNCSGIAMHHHRAVKLRGDVGFVRRAEVVAVLELLLDQALRVGIVEHLCRVVVAETGEGRLD